MRTFGRACLDEVGRLDVACYAAIAETPTPNLDTWIRALSRGADNSRLSIAAAGGLALLGGRRGRRAAALGLGSVAVTSALVNLAIKPLAPRSRPDRVLHRVPATRHVPMPSSRSFPSGHSAAAFAFAAGVGRALPVASLPLHALAGAVAYSRVHTGVHYPVDAITGALLGAALGQITSQSLDALLPRA
jgi:undecaprenyl-diphosphatase